MYRRSSGEVEVFLVHPGGPYWSKKNEGFWTIPKGEYETEEEPLAAASASFRKRLDLKLLNSLSNLDQ